jgi:hypothetical protein
MGPAWWFPLLWGPLIPVGVAQNSPTGVCLLVGDVLQAALGCWLVGAGIGGDFRSASRGIISQSSSCVGDMDEAGRDLNLRCLVRYLGYVSWSWICCSRCHNLRIASRLPAVGTGGISVTYGVKSGEIGVCGCGVV